MLPDITAQGKRVITYGFSPQADLRAENLVMSPQGAAFHASFRDTPLGQFDLPITGRHNAQNAMAAICVGLELGMTADAIRTALSGFAGVARRFEKKGEVNGITVVDDYGHHPTEVKAVLAAARESFPEQRLIVVFQPHRYTRTRDQLEGFAQAFHAADSLLLMDIYAAGEAPIQGVSSAALLERIKGFGHRDARLVPDHTEVLTALKAETMEGDVILTLGAGDVWKVGDAFLADGDGRIFLSANPLFVGRSLAELGWSGIDSATPWTDEAGRDHWVALAPGKAYMMGPHSAWRAGLTVPVEMVSGRSDDLSRRLIIIMAAVIICSVFMLFVLRRSIRGRVR